MEGYMGHYFSNGSIALLLDTIYKVILIFSALIELVQELVICNMHNKFRKDTWKNFSSYRAHK